MFDFFSLMVAVVALIVSAKAFKQITMLRARLERWNVRLARRELPLLRPHSHHISKRNCQTPRRE